MVAVLGATLVPVIGASQSFDVLIYKEHSEGIGLSIQPGLGFGNHTISGGTELALYNFATGQTQPLTVTIPAFSDLVNSAGKARKLDGTVEQLVGNGKKSGQQSHAIVVRYGPSVSGQYLDDGGGVMSTALGTDGTAIVGSLNPTSGTPPEAVYWAHPDEAPFILQSFGAPAEAYGVDAGFIVGNAGFSQHATVWNRTNFDPLDINPDGFTSSSLYGISDAAGGHQTVGWGFKGGKATGFISDFNGTAWSTSVLSAPTGFSETYLYDTDGVDQVGSGRFIDTNRQHALLYTGSDFGPVDLHGFTSGLLSSEARHIDEQGNVFGFGLTTDFKTVGVAWMRQPVPEPGTLVVAGVSLVSLARRRRKRG